MALFRRISNVFCRSQVEAEIDAELKSHVEMRIEDNVAAGMSPEKARHDALLRFGNPSVIKERATVADAALILDTTWADIRYALRRLRKSPAFATTAILTLALGIGANTAIFSIIYTVMLKSLPVANPQQIYRLGNGNDCCSLTDPQAGEWNIFSYPLYQYLKENTPEFQELAAFEGSVMNLSVRRKGSDAPADPFGGEFVTGNYFQMFGLRAFAGRLTTPADDMPSAPPVTVMSYRTWREHYERDTSVIGSTFIIRSVPMTVVGIAPPGFFGDTVRTDPPGFWFPMSTEPQLHGSNSMIHRPEAHWLYVVGRIRDGVSKKHTESRITTELRQWLQNQKGATVSDRMRAQIFRQSVYLSPAGTGVARMSTAYGKGLQLLMMASVSVLLIACANVANLLLSRSIATRVQSSLRIALGARRMRLMRQTVIESLILGLCGGAAGLVVAYCGTRFILYSAFRGTHFVPIEAAPSLPVLAFSFGTSLAATMICGLSPTWVATHADPADALRAANRSSGRKSSHLQKFLLVTQVALSVMLLAIAGLLTQSLRKLRNQSFGFETQGRLMIKVNPASAGYRSERLPILYRQLEQKLTAIPGVISASFSLYSPLEGTYWDIPVFIEGQPASSEDQQNVAAWDRVGPYYFETIGTHLLRGRGIEEHDTPATRNVAVINQAFADKYFRNQDPIGQHFGMGELKDAGDLEVVGVVENAKYYDARGPAPPMFFRPLLQLDAAHDPGDEIRSQFIRAIEIRSATRSLSLEPLVRQAIYDIDPNMAVLNTISFEEQVARNFNQENMIADLSGLFGLLALAIASVGLYGVMSYMVVQQTTEIGVRMALGASRSTVLGMVLKSALMQTAIGLAIGISGALVMGHFIAAQIYDVKIYDPVTMCGTAVALGLCALMAGIIPARLAASVDPMQALRSE